MKRRFATCDRAFLLCGLLAATLCGGEVTAPSPTVVDLVSVGPGLVAVPKTDVATSVWYVPSSRILPSSFFTPSEVLATAASTDLGLAYGFWVAQTASLEACITQYPELTGRALLASQAFTRHFGPALQQYAHVIGDFSEGKVTAASICTQMTELADRSLLSDDPAVRATGVWRKYPALPKADFEQFLTLVEGRVAGGIEPRAVMRAFARMHPMLRLYPEGSLGKVFATTWSSAGHPKSRGITVKVTYPGFWEAKDGDGSMIVQKFTEPLHNIAQEGMPMVTMQIIPLAVTEKDIGDATSLTKQLESFGRDAVPKEAVISSSRVVDMAMTKALEVVHVMAMSRPDGDYRIKTIEWIIVIPGAIVKLSGAVTARPPSDRQLELFDHMTPLFRGMAGLLRIQR